MNNKSVQKKYFLRILSAMLLFVQFVSMSFFTQFVSAAAPTNIVSYQGRLLNSNRAPVSDASASILFQFYTAVSGGSCVWSNSSSTCASATARTVTLTDGLFSENLGDTGHATPYAAIGDAIFGDNSTLFLQITINGELLTPRKQLTAAPYALNAQMLDGLDSDADGSSAAAIVAYNSSGNLVVTGNPGGSGVANGSMYINPASGDVAANDILFGVAVSGSSRFRVDGEGDTTISGNFVLDGGAISTTAAQGNVFDDTTGGSRVDIGGVDADRADTINIGTNAISADTITLGNTHASTTVVINGGTAWSVNSGGTATFAAMNCSDCIDWSDFSDSASLDAHTTVTLGASNFIFNVTSTGDFVAQTSSGDVMRIAQSGSISQTLNATFNPGILTTNNGSGNIVTNIVGTGDVTWEDNGGTFLTLSDTGAYTFALDNADNPAYTITNSGSSNVITNLSGTGDFVVQDNGTAFVTFSDIGTIAVTDNFTVVSSSREGNIANTSTIAGTWTGALGSRDISSTNIKGYYRANEAVGTDAGYSALSVYAEIDSTGDLNTMHGALIGAVNSSTDAAAVESSMYGIFGYGSNIAAVTLPNVYGLYGQVSAGAGTITSGYGVYGNVSSGAGSFTTGYGGYFQNLSEGTTRYGVVGNASGGTNNYAGYFMGALTLLDDNADPTDTPASNAAVAGAGDLFVRDSLEGDGSLYYGDTSGADDFIFTSNSTSGTVFKVNANAVAANTGLELIRSSGVATDFDGILFNVQQNRSSAGSDGIVFYLQNLSGGNSAAMYITQDQVADATTTPNAQALVIDVNESANNDEVIIIRSDADNSGGVRDTEFRFENDGDAFADGAWTGAGADYAEFFPNADRSLGDYELVCWDPDHANGVRRCASGDTNVVGVISTNPGFIGNSYSGAETSLENNPNYALVGLVGQIETYVSADAGAIEIGDALTTSASRAGYASKTAGGTYIIGRALEPLASGTGTIKVLVQPMWYGGEMLAMNGVATQFTDDIALRGAQATAADTSVDSAGLSFVGSAWNGSSANEVSLSIRNNVLGNGSARLSLQNDDGMDVMTFGSTGDLALAGNFYPSDRGALQYGAYVYYDSTDAGYMRTNAAGWSSNSSNFAESFASADLLVPGDVVEFALDGSGVTRSVGETYSSRVAGVVSARSAFVAGSSAGTYPVAVSGRVSTKVSDENGAIVPGDALTTSSRAGFAMKATDSGQIIGYALESWVSGEGSILAFIRPQYVAAGGSNVSSSLVVASQDIENLNVSGVLSMNGGDIVSVGALSGIGTWEIRENGDIVTNGQLTQVVESLQNTRVSTYATTSTETIVQLSGTSILHHGMARVNFEDIDQNYNDVISPDGTYRVLVTPNGVTGQLYVTDRSNAGFIIRDASQGEGVSVDWLVLAYRHDLVPEDRGNTDVTNDEANMTDSEIDEADYDGIEGGSDVIGPDEDLPVEENELTNEESVDETEGEELEDEEGGVLEDILESPEASPENAP